MTKLIGLFTNQADVSQAVQNLAAANVEDKDVQVLEALADESNEVETPIIASHPSMYGDNIRPVAAVPADSLRGLSLSGEMLTFVRRAVADGSILLLVTVSDETVNQAKTIITAHNGRILETAV